MTFLIKKIYIKCNFIYTVVLYDYYGGMSEIELNHLEINNSEESIAPRKSSLIKRIMYVLIENWRKTLSRAENIKRIREITKTKREYMKYRDFIDSNADKWITSFCNNKYWNLANTSIEDVMNDLKIKILYLITAICRDIRYNTLLIKSVAWEEIKIQKLKKEFNCLKDLPIEALQFWYQPLDLIDLLGNYYSYDEEDRAYKYRFPEDVINVLVKLWFKYWLENNQ